MANTLTIGQAAYAAMRWISVADQGVSDDVLIAQIRVLFSTGDSPIIVWHPTTTRVAALFRSGDGYLTFVSAGVTNETALTFANGWNDPVEVGGGLRCMSATVEDVIGAAARSRAIFAEMPRRFFGHSGGGAMASVFAHRSSVQRELQQSIWLVTFGAPAAIAGTIPQLPPLSVYLRCISEFDPVPGLPYDAHDLTRLGQATVVALNGPRYRPWNFVHGRVLAFVKGDSDTFYSTSSACRSTSANTPDLVRWITGTDGREGNPHRSTTYARRLSADVIDEMALKQLVDASTSIPDEPQPPPEIDLAMIIRNDPEVIDDVVAIDPTTADLVPADDLNFPNDQPQWGGVPVTNSASFHVRTRKGVTTVLFGGVAIATYSERGDGQRLANTLNRMAHELSIGDPNPDAIAAVVQAVAAGQLPV